MVVGLLYLEGFIETFAFLVTLVRIPPFGWGFQGIEICRSDDDLEAAKEHVPVLPFIVLDEPTSLSLGIVASPQSPLPFQRQDHCSSATSIGLNFQMPVIRPQSRQLQKASCRGVRAIRLTTGSAFFRTYLSEY